MAILFCILQLSPKATIVFVQDVWSAWLGDSSTACDTLEFDSTKQQFFWPSDELLPVREKDKK